MDTPSSSADLWPQNAVPQSWVNALFTKMARMWGNTFLDKWRDGNLEGVKVEWAQGLAKLSRTELKAGVDALMTLKFPPSLPEFYALCKSMRLAEQAPSPALTDQTRASPETVDANMQRMRDLVSRAMAPRALTAEWAYRLLMRGTSESGKALPAEVVRCASDAIASGAGAIAISECADSELRAEYQTIRDAVLASRRHLEVA